jgi:hypothetical protein
MEKFLDAFCDVSRTKRIQTSKKFQDRGLMLMSSILFHLHVPYRPLESCLERYRLYAL